MEIEYEYSYQRFFQFYIFDNYFGFNARCANSFVVDTELISAVHRESALKDYDTINSVRLQNSESILPSKLVFILLVNNIERKVLREKSVYDSYSSCI